MNTKESKETVNKRVVAIQSGQNIELCPLENKDSFANEMCNVLSKQICSYARTPDPTMNQKCDIVIIGDIGIGTTVFAKNLLRAIAKESLGNIAKVDNISLPSLVTGIELL